MNKQIGIFVVAMVAIFAGVQSGFVTISEPKSVNVPSVSPDDTAITTMNNSSKLDTVEREQQAVVVDPVNEIDVIELEPNAYDKEPLDELATATGDTMAIKKTNISSKHVVLETEKKQVFDLAELDNMVLSDKGVFVAPPAKEVVQEVAVKDFDYGEATGAGIPEAVVPVTPKIAPIIKPSVPSTAEVATKAAVVSEEIVAETVKSAVIANPEKAAEIVTEAVMKNPEHVVAIVKAAVEAGADLEEMRAAALAAGGDEALIYSDATAAGGRGSGPGPSPVGPDGDNGLTASPN